MAKVKNKRNAGLADRVQNKKKGDINKKKLNPFEVHINKEKLKVLGKKSKHDRGLPGVSRAKAMQKRKETLGTEMKLMNKTNTFIDRRIGEKNNQLSAEDRMIARFAAERVKQHNKKNIYNLADDEILTHRGQTLEQIEQYDDPRSDEEDDDIGKKLGGLDDDFVSEGHFGGGILSKTDAKDGAKSHKDLIEQLIAESKKRKAEKQKEKEQTLDLTEKLDSEWKDLQPVVFKRPRVEESAIDKVLSQAEKKSEDYDKMMRELRFEKRGTPSDGLKSDEKLAKEEREKLEQWEKERDARMRGDEVDLVVKQPVTPKHRSADDLDDNFELDDEKEFMLAYDKDGNPLVPENVLKNFTVPNAKPKFDDGISDTSEDDDNEESGEDSDDESTGENEEIKENDKINGETNKKNKEDRGGLFQDDNSDDESSNDGDNKESHKDNTNKKDVNVLTSTNNTIEQSESESSDDNVDKQTDKKVTTKTSQSNEKTLEYPESNKNITKSLDNTEIKTKKQKVVDIDTKIANLLKDDDGSDEEESDSEKSADDVDDLKDLRESEASSDESVVGEERIDSFFDFKSGVGDNLKALLTGKSPSQQSIALEKLIKSYDPSQSENNKELLSKLFAHLLQYINDIFTDLTQDNEVVKAFLIFDRLVPHMYDLTKTNKVSTKKFLIELLKEKHDLFKRRPRRMPDLDTLIFFKLISIIYPTSDFRHPVTTPSLFFMSEILTTARFVDGYSVSRGLFVTALILEYTSLSKRFVPAAINFLRGILFLTANISILNPIQVVPPFRLHNDDKILNLEDDCSKMAVDNKMAARDLVEEIDSKFKIRSLLTCCLMLKEFFDHCNEMEAQECIFESHIKLLGRIDLDLYPPKVASVVTEIIKYMKESLEVKTFTPLTRERKRPKALRLYEPDVQEVFTGSKSGKLPREMAERRRLQSKCKREMKGALREIRRDKAYVASVKIRQQLHSDKIRRDKVKQIYREAAVQQGELNKMKRMK